MKTSQRLQEIPPSGTVAISNLVSKLRAEGQDIISFSLGEPDFATPSNIVDACVNSLQSGFTHYTPSTGIPELKKAIAESTKKKNGIPCEASDVLVTPTKQALFMIALAYLDPGDEVREGDHEQCLLRRCYEDIGCFAGDAVLVPGVVRDGLLQLGDTGGGGVVGESALQGVHACVYNVGGCGEVGLTEREGDDVLSFCPELAYKIGDGDRSGRRNLLESLGCLHIVT